eukprot:15798338-Heterocapsa_arctica.AAC.1
MVLWAKSGFWGSLLEPGTQPHTTSSALRVEDARHVPAPSAEFDSVHRWVVPILPPRTGCSGKEDAKPTNCAGGPCAHPCRARQGARSCQTPRLD